MQHLQKTGGGGHCDSRALRGNGSFFRRHTPMIGFPEEATVDSAKLVLSLLEEAYEKKTWHGPNLKQSLKGVTARQAAWRPGPRRHNIWEVTVHAAYWKYAVRRRLTGEKRGSFALKGSNWFQRPVAKLGAGNERTWEEDVRLLIDQHRK